MVLLESFCEKIDLTLVSLISLKVSTLKIQFCLGVIFIYKKKTQKGRETECVFSFGNSLSLPASLLSGVTVSTESNGRMGFATRLFKL